MIQKFWKQSREIIYQLPERNLGIDAWFVGSITDENRRSSEIAMEFLTPGKKYIATIYADDKKADLKTNPEA